MQRYPQHLPKSGTHLDTVPLKSKLPPSHKTRFSSRETRHASRGKRVPSREKRNSSPERLKNTASTKTCRSRVIKTSIVKRDSKFCSLTQRDALSRSKLNSPSSFYRKPINHRPLNDQKINRFENFYLQKLIESFEIDHYFSLWSVLMRANLLIAV